MPIQYATPPGPVTPRGARKIRRGGAGPHRPNARFCYHCEVTRRRRGLALTALLSALAATSCEVIGFGPEVGVPGRCTASSELFVAEVVPDFLEKFDCASQSEGGCHAVSNGLSIYQLEDTSGELAPLPTDPPGSWPAGWQANFDRTVAQISDCDIAELSPLYSEPAGGDTAVHGGDDMFDPDGPELELLQRWLDGSGD
jgi:hypothetical protein